MNGSAMPASVRAGTAADTRQPAEGCECLIFSLGSEEYAIDIRKVQEIRGYGAVTRIPDTPAFIKGVVNLRGLIVPIVDMRIKFALRDPTYDQHTVVIVLNALGRVIGLVVDGVSDVATLSADQVRPAPELTTAQASFVKGLGMIDERMVILVDIDKLLGSGEMQLFDSAARAA